MRTHDEDSNLAAIDLERPNAARVYDWYLDGTTNWAIDREFGAKAKEAFPMVAELAKVGREFLGRGVRYMAEQGITQFLDLGSGVPTVGNVHEIADEINPDSRCVYVDNEPVAVAHSRILLEREGDPTRHTVLAGDLLDVSDIWRRTVNTGVLDPGKPIGLIAVGVLYFFGPDDDPHGVIARYRDLLPSGSYLLSSHMTLDGVPATGEEERARVREQYARASSQLHIRDEAEFTRFFDGFDLVEPGVSWVPSWRPDDRDSPASRRYLDNPAASSGYAALGRKSD